MNYDDEHSQEHLKNSSSLCLKTWSKPPAEEEEEAFYAISPNHLLNQWSFSARLDQLPIEERRRRIPQVHSICSISEAPVQDLISFQQKKKKKKKKNSACIIPKSMFSDSAGIRWSSISRRRVIMCCYSGCQASLSISYYRTCFCHVFPSSVPPCLDLLSG